MKEKIMMCAMGQFNYEPVGVQVSEENLHLIALPCDSLQGILTIKAKDGTAIQGIVTVDDNRVVVSPEVFMGEEVQITYTFPAATAMKEKELKGFIYLTTNCGQIDVPYSIRVAAPVMKVEDKEVHTLEEFTQAAKENPEKGLASFAAPEFSQTFLGKDRVKRRLYDDLISQNNTEWAMEEFLMTIGMKEKIHFSLNRNRFEFPRTKGTFLIKVGVNVSTWGFMDIQVEAEGGFLSPLVKQIRTSEFIGNNYILDVEVDTRKLMSGKKHGRVALISPYDTQYIEVYVNQSEENPARQEQRDKKRHIERLMKYYLDFRLHRCIFADFVMGMDREIDSLKELGYEYVTLWETLIGIIAERKEEVERQLKEWEMMRKPSTTAAEEEVVFYLASWYLRAFFSREEKDVQKAVKEIREYYEESYHLPILCWFLIYLDEQLKNPVSRLEELNDHLEASVNSPVFYFEAYRIYEKNPQLFREITKENLRVFEWAVKKEIMTQDLAMQFAYAATRVHSYHARVTKCLMKLYEEYPTTDILQAVCAQLIRGDKRQPLYFEWYERGVKEKLRLTDLFEYYMYSRPEELMVLPELVLSYFQYENHLADRTKAFLYDCVVSQKDIRVDIYEDYREQMIAFTNKSLLEERIDVHYAKLYQEFLDIDELTSVTAEALSHILFKAEVTCCQKDMMGVYVVYPQVKNEIFYPLRYKKTMIDMAEGNVQLRFCDRKGNSYIRTADYSLRYFFSDCSSEQRLKIVKKCFELGVNSTEIFLVLFNKVLKSPRLLTKDVILCQMIVDSKILTPQAQSQAVRILFHYYRQHQDSAMQREMIRLLDFHYIDKQYAKDLLNACIKEGAIRKAKEGIEHFGFRQIDLDELKKLCLMELHTAKDDDMLLIRMCYYLIWQGFEERPILKYLNHCYTGTVQQMMAIYSKSVEHQLEVTELVERMLAQVLFVDGDSSLCEDAFLVYYHEGNNRVLVKAFLSYMAYQYIVNKIDLLPEIVDIMKQESIYEDNIVVLLALLKAYSTKSQLTEREKDFAVIQIEKMWRLGIMLDFMKNFSGKIVLPYEIEHCEIVQEYANKVSSLTCYAKREEEDEYTSYRMREVYQHIFIKEFLLFPGEKMTYYIEETQIKELCGKEKRWAKDSLFALLQENVCDYVKREELASSLLQPIHSEK